MSKRFATPAYTRSQSQGPGRATTGEHRPVPYPIVLQQRAREAQRTAFLRTALRTVALITGDVLVIGLGAMTIRALRALPVLNKEVAEIAGAMVPAGMLPRQQVIVAGILGLAICGSYNRSRWHTTRPVVTGFSLGLALVFWSHLWEDRSPLGLVGFFVTVVALGLLLRVGRGLQSRLRDWVRPRTLGIERALIVGDAAFARGVQRYEPLMTEHQFAVVGYVDVAESPASDALGGVADLIRLIEQHKIESLLLSPRLDDELFSDLLYASDNASVGAFVFGSAYATAGFAPQTVVRGTVPLVQLTRPALKAHQLFLKRAFDICGASVGLILASPFMLVVAVLVKVTSRGPIVFRQVRVGHGGARFGILKFRSMVADAEPMRAQLGDRSVYGDGRLFKLDQDPRVTPLGAFLRRTSIDELPQLWNVLKGDMSLVGPRPPLPSEVVLYDEHHYSRFGMKPGITGPWQVSGRNNIKAFDDVIALETEYLNGWNIWKDLDIVVRTVPAVLSMKGAR